MLESYTGPEIERWLHIRAIEWTAWPSFITQPVVPILFVFYPWYWVLVGVFLIGIPWCAVRYSFVSLRLAQLAVFFVLLKWPAALGSAIYLFIERKYVPAIIALLWPLVAGFIGVPRKIGIVELEFAKRLGYIVQGGNRIR